MLSSHVSALAVALVKRRSHGERLPHMPLPLPQLLPLRLLRLFRVVRDLGTPRTKLLKLCFHRSRAGSAPCGAPGRST